MPDAPSERQVGRSQEQAGPERRAGPPGVGTNFPQARGEREDLAGAAAANSGLAASQAPPALFSPLSAAGARTSQTGKPRAE